MDKSHAELVKFIYAKHIEAIDLLIAGLLELFPHADTETIIVKLVENAKKLSEEEAVFMLKQQESVNAIMQEAFITYAQAEWH